MQFGLYPPLTQRGGHIDRLWADIVDAAKVAEAVGFNSCLFGEHHQGRDGYLTSPLLLAGMLAMQTRTLRVGTCLLLLPLYHPIRVAEDAALVDLTSGGRLLLGVGLGYLPPDFAAFAVSPKERVSRLEEGVQVLRQAWTGPKVSFSGRRYQLEGIAVTPKPLQQPHPPIWLGGSSASGVRRAARLGDGWICDGMQGREAIARLAGLYREECVRLGKTPRIGLMRQVWIADSRAKVIEEYERAIVGLYRFIWRNRDMYAATESWAQDATSVDGVTLDRVPLDRFILGTPEEAIEQVADWHELGVEHLVIGFHHPDGPPAGRVNEVIRTFGESVIAKL